MDMNCVYMSGAGNTFAVIDVRQEKADLSALAVSLCARTKADGLLAVDNSQRADFRLHYYNSDGTRADLCGNGTRCICKYAYDHRIAGESMTVETDAGIVPGWRVGENTYRIRLVAPTQIQLQVLPQVDYAVVGVPHAIREIPGLCWEQKDALREQAAALRHHPAFPKGTNVDFYTWLDDTTVRALSYERGVEDYTLACGTGCGALCALLYLQGKLPEGKLTVHNPGGVMHLEAVCEDGTVTGLFLEGPAQVLDEFAV